MTRTCNGICIYGAELIDGAYGVAYAHPDCELHSPPPGPIVKDAAGNLLSVGDKVVYIYSMQHLLMGTVDSFTAKKVRIKRQGQENGYMEIKFPAQIARVE